MTEKKWTPGLWIVSKAYDEVSVCMGTAIDSPYEYDCAHVWKCPDVYWSEEDTESMANAHLIAAAPKMYEALEAFVNNSSVQTSSPNECEAAEAAMAEARGESQ